MDLKNYKHVHCVGIGGIGLSGIAEILLSRGYRVSGSDMKESSVTEMLEQQGAQVFIGHSADNLGDTDLLVYSAAVSMENPELAEARRRGIPIISRADALGAIMAASRMPFRSSSATGAPFT